MQNVDGPYEQQAFDLTELEPPVPPRRTATLEELYNLRRALEPFVDLELLREYAAARQDMYAALRCEQPPAEIRALIETLAAVLTPLKREQIKSPSDIAALLMVEMGTLEQEEMRVVLLDTKNQVQDIVTVYRGSVNTALVRIGEIYKEAIRRNSVALIRAHNHPSGIPDPSPVIWRIFSSASITI